MKLADGLGMGYLGVDFVLDADIGPVVLEANARPGLNIQVANRCGLLPRLRFLDAQYRGGFPRAAAWSWWPPWPMSPADRQAHGLRPVGRAGLGMSDV